VLARRGRRDIYSRICAAVYETRNFLVVLLVYFVNQALDLSGSGIKIIDWNH
jgi:hypothetical protein